MNIIFLYGPPGVGKLTVAKELVKITEYKLFHNHLTVDLVHSVFDFKTEPFIELRDKIWMSVFAKVKEEQISGLVFTFAPEESVPANFIPNLIDLVEDEQNKIYFVKLTCDVKELKKRIVDPSRLLFHKGTSTDNLEKHYAREHLIPNEVHKRTYTIDTTSLSPTEAASMIVDHYKLN